MTNPFPSLPTPILYEIGLLKLVHDDQQASSLVPSQLERQRIGQKAEFRLGNLSKWAPKLQGNRSSLICWNFKADLLSKASALKKSSSYSMLSLRASSIDGASVSIAQDALLSPHIVAEEFLGNLCELTVQKLKSIWGEDIEPNFYFSAPGYDIEEARIYRDNIRSILKKISDRPLLKTVKFSQAEVGLREQFLYEQYGVYYYFARCEQQIDLDKPKANYLIIDIGGSTTDVAVVHLTKSGDISRVFPIYKSFPFGGSSYNEVILKQLIRDRSLTEEQRNEALQHIEQIKLKILENPKRQHNLPLKIGDSTIIVTRERLDNAFDYAWNWKLKEYILRVLEEAAQDERINYKDEKFVINGILLAGGSSKLERFQNKLSNDQELKPYFAEDCKIIAAHLAHPSSLAAVGLSVSIAERILAPGNNNLGEHGELSIAEEIYFPGLFHSK